MQLTNKLVFIILVFIFITTSVKATTLDDIDRIRIFKFNTVNNATYSYFKDVLQLTLTKAAPYKELDIIEIPSDGNMRNSWERLLNQNYIDVIWAGTNKEREQSALPVRIPLLGGLLGYRTAIINRNKLSYLKQQSPEQLKQLVSCQKSSWPDTKILAHNHFKVLRVSRFELMFKMVAHNRCDFFPRAIFEAQPEATLAQQRYPQLMVFDDVILHYPFAMYFFVAQDNPKLAKLLTLGLTRAIKDGSLHKLRLQHPITKNLFPLSKWHNKTFIQLKNPFLPPKLPTEDASFWLKLEPTQK